MKVIGVTGSFGSGKTTVSKILKNLGAVVLNADKITHGVLANVKVRKKILAIFGKGILGKNKKINRRYLGEAAFKNKLLLAKLCKIIHPPVIQRMKSQIKHLRSKRPDVIVVMDAPLLIEAGLSNMVDKLIVVTVNRDLQIKRCKKSTGLDKKNILTRIKIQMPIKEKIRFSDFIIDNSGTEERTKRKVKRIWEQIQRQTVQKKRI
ncbi:MAG: dephospho-CoA kinase [Candidatus Omnitrophica bacterium]|nr:dephospho-CoA kinase [Candidatus Omnitrophota bacterium]